MGHNLGEAAGIGVLLDENRAMTGRMRRIGARIPSARALQLAGPRKAVGRFLSKVGLFPAILTALGAGLVVAVAAQWALHQLITTNHAAAQPIDVTKLSLTVVAGVGGIVALVVAYRRQRDIEQGRFVERFGAAARATRRERCRCPDRRGVRHGRRRGCSTTRSRARTV